MDVEGVKITALRVLFDVLHSFGLDAFGVSDAVDATGIGQGLSSVR